MHTWRRLAAVVLVLATLVLGCDAGAGRSAGTSPGASGLTTLPSGIPLITAGAGGPDATTLGTPLNVAVDLPAGWRNVEMTDAGINTAIAEVGGANPTVAAALRQLLSGGQQNAIRVYGLDLAGTKVIGNVNVSTAKFAGLSPDTAAQLYASQIIATGATDVSTTHVSLPAGSGAVVAYKLKLPAGSEPAISGRSYLILRDGWGYVTTVSCYEADPAPCLADADKIANTLRIGA
jgi:hypothetical protein